MARRPLRLLDSGVGLGGRRFQERFTGSMAKPLDIFGRPARARRLLVCTGPCCDGDGQASAQLAALRQLLIERGLNEESVGAASCVRRSCLGKCSGEPLAQVMPEEVWYRYATGENLLRIYERHVVNRQPVDELLLEEVER